jgi:hypothetical protein
MYVITILVDTHRKTMATWMGIYKPGLAHTPV